MLSRLKKHLKGGGGYNLAEAEAASGGTRKRLSVHDIQHVQGKHLANGDNSADKISNPKSEKVRPFSVGGTNLPISAETRQKCATLPAKGMEFGITKSRGPENKTLHPRPKVPAPPVPMHGTQTFVDESQSKTDSVSRRAKSGLFEKNKRAGMVFTDDQGTRPSSVQIRILPKYGSKTVSNGIQRSKSHDTLLAVSAPPRKRQAPPPPPPVRVDSNPDPPSRDTKLLAVTQNVSDHQSSDNFQLTDSKKQSSSVLEDVPSVNFHESSIKKPSSIVSANKTCDNVQEPTAKKYMSSGSSDKTSGNFYAEDTDRPSSSAPVDKTSHNIHDTAVKEHSSPALGVKTSENFQGSSTKKHSSSVFGGKASDNFQVRDTEKDPSCLLNDKITESFQEPARKKHRSPVLGDKSVANLRQVVKESFQIRDTQMDPSSLLNNKITESFQEPAQKKHRSSVLSDKTEDNLDQVVTESFQIRDTKKDPSLLNDKITESFQEPPQKNHGSPVLDEKTVDNLRQVVTERCRSPLNKKGGDADFHNQAFPTELSLPKEIKLSEDEKPSKSSVVACDMSEEHVQNNSLKSSLVGVPPVLHDENSNEKSTLAVECAYESLAYSPANSNLCQKVTKTEKDDTKNEKESVVHNQNAYNAESTEGETAVTLRHSLSVPDVSMGMVGDQSSEQANMPNKGTGKAVPSGPPRKVRALSSSSALVPDFMDIWDLQQEPEGTSHVFSDPLYPGFQQRGIASPNNECNSDTRMDHITNTWRNPANVRRYAESESDTDSDDTLENSFEEDNETPTDPIKLDQFTFQPKDKSSVMPDNDSPSVMPSDIDSGIIRTLSPSIPGYFSQESMEAEIVYDEEIIDDGATTPMLPVHPDLIDDNFQFPMNYIEVQGQGEDGCDQGDGGSKCKNPVEDWTNQDVLAWCESRGLELYMEVFEECGVVGTDVLLMTMEDVVDLEVGGPEMQKMLMKEIEELRVTPSSTPFYHLKQASVKRKTLEMSSVLIQDRLDNLQRLNQEQHKRITSSLQELQEEQQRTAKLLEDSSDQSYTESLTPRRKTEQPALVDEVFYKASRADRASAPADLGLKLNNLDRRLSTSEENLNPDHDGTLKRRTVQRRSSTGDLSAENGYSYLRVPLAKWTNTEVVHWMQTVGLDKFVQVFSDHGITGKQLAEINMPLLDSLDVETTEDRELILAKLYELQHPGGPSLEEVLGIPLEDAGTTIDSASPSPVIARSMKSQRNRSSGLLPRLFGSHAETDCIQVWSELPDPGALTSSSVRVTEATTSKEVVHQLLDKYGVTNDYNLYYLAECYKEAQQEWCGRELGCFECPLAAQKRWLGAEAGRFELRQKSGGAIKVICRVSGLKPRGKSFRIAHESTCRDVLHTALGKFQMKHVDPKLFCLMEIDKDTGDVKLIQDHEVILDLDSDAFVLSDRANLELVYDGLASLRLEKGTLERNPSMNSQGSSIASHSSTNSGESDGSKPRVEKLQTLEAQMADIEASITKESTEMQEGSRSSGSAKKTKPTSSSARRVLPKKPTPPPTDPAITTDTSAADRLELLQELEILKESIHERDSTITALQQENKHLQERAEQAVSLQRRLAETERALSKQQEHTLKQDKQKQEASTSKRLHTSPPTNVSEWLEARISELEIQLREVSKKVKESEQSTRRNQGMLQQHRNNHSSDALWEKTEQDLQQQVHNAEASLLDLKKRQADLYAQLELTRHDKERYHTKDVKVPNLYKLVGTNKPQCLTCLELSPEGGSYGFLVSSDPQRHLVISHAQEGRPVKKGDRILEINGQNTQGLEEGQFNSILRKSKSICMVTLGSLEDQPITKQDIPEEVHSLKEDLSLAIMELESVQQDNTDLREEVEGLENIKRKLEDDQETLQTQLEKITEQMAAQKQQWQELRTTLIQLQNEPVDVENILIEQHHGSKDSQVAELQREKQAMKEEINRLRKSLARNIAQVSHLTAALQGQGDSSVAAHMNQLSAMERLNKLLQGTNHVPGGTTVPASEEQSRE